LNPKAKIMLLKTMGMAIKILAVLWLFSLSLTQFIIPLTQQGAEPLDLFSQMPLISVYGLGIAFLYWLGSKLSAAAVSASADLEARFIGYMELYEDIGLGSLAEKLEMNAPDVENLIAKMKARGSLKDVAVSKETNKILYGKKAREYIEVSAKMVREAEKVKVVKEEPPKRELPKQEVPKREPRPPPQSTPAPETRPRANGPSTTEIDDKLHSYVLSQKGSFSYSQASRVLGIPIADLKEAMERLKKNGRVISYRKGSPTLRQT